MAIEMPAISGRTLISTIVIVGFFVIIAFLIIKPINITGDVGEVLKVLLGGLGAKFGDVVSYHIGSSSGSKEKDSIVRSVLNQPDAEQKQ